VPTETGETSVPHTPDNTLVRGGEPCPDHPHVHVRLEPWLRLLGHTHLTARLWVRSCDAGTPVAAATVLIVGPQDATPAERRQEVGVWRAFWWHLTRSGPWYKGD